jgi:hypothetical protein
VYIYDNISLNSSWNEKYFKVVDEIKRIIYSITFSENGAVYDTKWKNMVEPDGSQVTSGACALHAG